MMYNSYYSTDGVKNSTPAACTSQYNSQGTIEFVQECGYPGHCTNQNPASTGIKTPEAIFNATDSPNWAGEAQEFNRNVKPTPGNRFILAIAQESEKRCTSGTHGGTFEVFFVKQSHGMCI